MIKKVYIAIAIAMTIQGFSESKTIEVSSKHCDKPYSCCTPSLYRNSNCDDKNVEFLIKGDFLFWEGKLCGLEGAFGNTSVIENNNTPAIQTTTLTEIDRSPDFKWRPGFKIGAELLVDCFDLELDWTHFHGSAHFAEKPQHGNWKIKYDTIDLIFGYNFYPCSRFLVKPFIGARGAKIHQSLLSHLETLTQRPLEEELLVTSNWDDKEKFWGVSPQVGVEADCYIGKNFSLYSMVDLVTYYGRTKCHYYHVNSFTATLNISNWEKSKCFNCLGMDGSIGLRWDKYITYSKCSIHYMLKLGVEQHRICDFSDLGSDGSLTLAGGVFEASIGFGF